MSGKFTPLPVLALWTPAVAYWLVVTGLTLLMLGCLAYAFKPSFDVWRRDRKKTRRGDYLPDTLFRRIGNKS